MLVVSKGSSDGISAFKSFRADKCELRGFRMVKPHSAEPEGSCHEIRLPL